MFFFIKNSWCLFQVWMILRLLFNSLSIISLLPLPSKLNPWTQSITSISFFLPFFETSVKFKGLIHYLQNQIYWFFWLPKFSKMRLYRFRISHLFETFKFLNIYNFFQIFNSLFFLIFFDFFYDFYCQESYINSASSYRYNIQD